jgi:hypothetical protein
MYTGLVDHSSPKVQQAGAMLLIHGSALFFSSLEYSMPHSPKATPSNNIPVLTKSFFPDPMRRTPNFRPILVLELANGERLS